MKQALTLAGENADYAAPAPHGPGSRRRAKAVQQTFGSILSPQDIRDFLSVYCAAFLVVSIYIF